LKLRSNHLCFPFCENKNSIVTEVITCRKTMQKQAGKKFQEKFCKTCKFSKPAAF
jgi:hypothetical protein